ncbi:serine/threonine-protein kinase PknG [Kineosporia sp. NBRC 101677]|uniref:serine/threonine-protein kinase n=1 Tax=Kineosporia sp. NBRC 101677 TaxID=3032197 RepID=UPI0024A362A3|nr:serine/threonine-protein kinase [Kineosporia sp. NBRC 101677]GLY13098.1 serine/threonine-protein kinase PknG [Kineosporia sp. NBRC 101677]
MPSTPLACTQPGCTGTIEDGYCNVCGSPAGVSAPAAAGGGPVEADSARVMSSRTASSNRLASAPLGSARAMGGTNNTRRLGSTSSRTRGARLGAGITTVPPAAVPDPLAAVKDDPQVPESRRYCPNCGNPVGRSRQGREGRPEGFCPNCRAPFSFTPKLKKGDLVAHQYEVVGAIAHGGLGWIYLAKDKNVSDRWVVLKGLLNSGDPDALAAAIAEQRFLAQVEHPLIVEIYNFVTHDSAGYIVMEYVGGKSLKDLLKDRLKESGGTFSPFPVDQAIAYILEVLPAFQYLHDTGLLYCDFKPDNIIQAGDSIKLIDLGGVRRIDDMDSAIYGTVGYQAPEVPDVGPSIASDIYTVGRSLVSLAMEFRGNTTTYATTLPNVADTPLFQQYDSLYRLLAKCCAPNPGDRFATADELRTQLLGVLREVVAAHRGERPASHSTASLLFEPPVVEGDRLQWDNLPKLKVDDTDPQAAWLASIDVDDPVAKLDLLLNALNPSIEVRLATAYTAVEARDLATADRVVGEILNDDPWEWRAIWLAGLAALARQDPTNAQAAFNAVYGQVPGELAPKLALAVACEEGNQPDIAESLYLTCLRTDANFTAAAAFGLARIRSQRHTEGQGELEAAIAALDMVPTTSRSFVSARRQKAALLVGSGAGLDALSAALESVSAVRLDPRDRAQLRVDVLSAALSDVNSGGERPDVTVGGVPAQAPGLQDELETAYRELAQLTEQRDERVRLVDEANRVRRWTWR